MNTQEILSQVYAAFNDRNIDRVLAWMSEDVNWPKASEGGKVIGKQAIREYWTRQWAAFDPHVDILEVVERQDGKTEVKVHQLVKNLAGEIIADDEVWHIYTIEDNRIRSMDLLEANGHGDGPTAAFAGHSH